MWGSKTFQDYIDYEDYDSKPYTIDGTKGTSKSLTAFLGIQNMFYSTTCKTTFSVLTVFGLIGTSGYFYKKSRDKASSVVQYNTMINDDVEPIDPGTADSNQAYRDDQNDSDDDAMLA